jgi:hypothetical protein
MDDHHDHEGETCEVGTGVVDHTGSVRAGKVVVRW